MSTRSSIFYHRDDDTGISIHIYEEAISERDDDIRIEIELPNCTVNVPWPEQAFREQLRERVEFLAKLDEARDSALRGEGRPITPESIRQLGESIKGRGRARLTKSEHPD